MIDLNWDLINTSVPGSHLIGIEPATFVLMAQNHSAPRPQPFSMLTDGNVSGILGV